MSTGSAARVNLALISSRDHAEAVRVLVEVDNLLDDLCWRLLDLYGRPAMDSPAQEREAGP